jgi:hypothetical protein
MGVAVSAGVPIGRVDATAAVVGCRRSENFITFWRFRLFRFNWMINRRVSV